MPDALVRSGDARPPTTNAVLRAWERLSPLPGGRILFSRLLGWKIPYTGTMSATVLELAPGHARTALRDRRRVRNHLDCIHAIAQMNLAEMTTGLAMTAGLPDAARAILTDLSITYTKKARGRLVAECRCDPPDGRERREVELVTEVRDAAGDVVSRATARWLVGPKV